MSVINVKNLNRCNAAYDLKRSQFHNKLFKTFDLKHKINGDDLVSHWVQKLTKCNNCGRFEQTSLVSMPAMRLDDFGINCNGEDLTYQCLQVGVRTITDDLRLCLHWAGHDKMHAITWCCQWSRRDGDRQQKRTSVSAVHRHLSMFKNSQFIPSYSWEDFGVNEMSIFILLKAVLTKFVD